MTRSATTLAATLATLLGLTAAVPPARAQTTTTPTFSKADFTISFRDKDDKYITGTALDRFFNRVNCECGAPVSVEVRLVPASRAKFSSTLSYDSKVRAGDDTCVCVGAACGSINCQDISVTQNAVQLLNQPMVFRTNVKALFQAGLPEGTDPSQVCNRDQAQSIWFWMDSSGDSDSSTDVTDVMVQVQIDGRGPPSPTGLVVTPGNQALSVAWDSLGAQSDLQGYQVLCSRGGDLAPFKGVFDPAFNISSSHCPVATNMTATLPLIDAGDLSINSAALAVRGAPTPPLAALNPDFLCSSLLTNQVDARLFRLQNDIPYVVGVVAIDKRGNPSAITEAVMETPKATQDFYTGYRAAGGDAEGGCSFAPRDTAGGTTAGGNPGRRGGAIALAGLLGCAAVLNVRCRRRGRNTTAGRAP